MTVQCTATLTAAQLLHTKIFCHADHLSKLRQITLATCFTFVCVNFIIYDNVLDFFVLMCSCPSIDLYAN